MKKSKKLLSLFLAALMLMSCFGAISASAMTMDAAEAAAAEFNATIPDHSAVYANKSAKQWNNTMTGLDKTLSAILKQVNIKESIYTDDTINKLIGLEATIFNLIKDAAGSYGSMLTLMLNPGKDAGNMKKIAELGQKWADNVQVIADAKLDYAAIDTAKLVWGVTPGNRAEFEEAASFALSGFYGNIFHLLASGGDESAMATIVNPILESLHAGKMPSSQELYDVPIQTEGNKKIGYIVNIICNAIDALAADPIAYLCEILPDFTNTLTTVLTEIKTNGLTLKIIVDITIKPEDLGMLPSDLDGLFDMIVPMIPSLLGLGEDYVMPALNLPEIDENYLITMGKAVAVESGMAGGARMAIEGNSTMVFAAVAQYVQEVLQDKNNQAAIGDLIVAKVGPDYLENYREIVDAALNGTPIDVADACLSFVEDYADSIIEQEDVNPVVAFFAKIVKFFSDLAKKIIALFK